MLSSDECRRRAEACTARAYGQDIDAKRSWHQLSELWMKWSDIVDPLTDPKRVALRFPPIWRGRGDG